MPAPPLPLIALLRSGRYTRRTFFELTHSGGTVRVCDGIGNFELDGAEYLSVGGLAGLDGISDSGDIQNHSVIAKLNGVALSSLASVDTNIRGETATIKFAWIDEAGNVAYSRTMAVLKGSHLQTKFDAREHSVAAHLRGPTAQWQTPPRAYYTDKDQQRRYSGDTGFSFVKYLENANASGWSVDEESTGGRPILIGNGIEGIGLRDNVALIPMGDAVLGMNAQNSSSKLKRFVSLTAYVEDVSGASIDLATVSAGLYDVQCGGANCYVDVSGDARTPGGELLIPSGGTSANKIRQQGTISADGTATGTSLDTAAPLVSTLIKKAGSTLNTQDQSGRVYCNKNGLDVIVVSNVPQDAAGNPYVEATTGTAVSFASGNMRVGANDCKVSTTGVILSNAGRRIIKQGGTADEFLRVWT